MSVNTRSNKDRDQKNTPAPSSLHEVEAYEASNGADMPMFANILPKPMSTPPAEATALPASFTARTEQERAQATIRELAKQPIGGFCHSPPGPTENRGRSRRVKRRFSGSGGAYPKAR